VARKEIAVKKYVVTLSDEERDQLSAMISKGKHPTRKLLKARILLKADTSGAGDGWSDSQIATALETSVDTVARTRQHLVEEGVDGALTHHHSPNSARRRIFDGEAEHAPAKALAESYIRGTIGQAPASEGGVEPEQPMVHCFRPRRPVSAGSAAGPPAQSCHDPGVPCE
jgi:hypothetical protein